MFKFTRIAIAIASLLAAPIASSGANYKIDKGHSSVAFKVRHLFSNTTGRFDDFEGSITFDPENFAAASVEGTIQSASINTNHEKRDAHLKNKDFFDVEKYPKITFKSTKISDVDDTAKTAKLHGNLTMHGVEKPVVLDVKYLGTAKDPWGTTRGGFSATTTINRKDFGIAWNETLDSGGLLIGEEVEIEINVEGMVTQ